MLKDLISFQKKLLLMQFLFSTFWCFSTILSSKISNLISHCSLSVWEEQVSKLNHIYERTEADDTPDPIQIPMELMENFPSNGIELGTGFCIELCWYLRFWGGIHFVCFFNQLRSSHGPNSPFKDSDSVISDLSSLRCAPFNGNYFDQSV